MNTAQKNASYFRKSILICGIVLTLMWVVWLILPFFSDVLDFDFYGLMATPLYWLGGTFNGDVLVRYSVNLLVYTSLFLLGQWMFLRPGKTLKINIAEKGRPLVTSIVSAGFMAMLLTVGLIYCVMEIANLFDKLNDSHSNIFWAVLIGVVLVSWIVWAVVFWVYFKQGGRYTQSGRIIRGLIAGSVLELLVAIPVQVVLSKQRDCYCAMGTYTTIAFAGTVLIWAFGPGVVLLYLRERYRRERLLADSK